VSVEEANLLADQYSATSWEASAMSESAAVEVVFSEILRLALQWKLNGSTSEKTSKGVDAQNDREELGPRCDVSFNRIQQ